MTYIKNRTILFSIMLLLTIRVFAQQADSLEIHNINGKPYYIHIVEKSESLYAISKKYNVPIDVIKRENPSTLDGLSIGEKLFLPAKKEAETENTFNGNVIKHEVLPQQTLYAISKIYNVKIKEIMAVNPDLTENLSEGQLINIPVKQIKSEQKEEEKIALTWKEHVVKKGETVYGISKLYKVSMDSLSLVNKGFPQGLKEGEKIFIPIKQNKTNHTLNRKDTLISSELLSVLEQAFDTSKSSKSVYKIGLMLPFYVRDNQHFIENRGALEKAKIYPKSIFAVEFYNGFLFALNSISTEDRKFELYVYDTNGQDSIRVASILEKPELKSLDLIVGPLYQSNFEVTAKFANANQIPIVSPVRQVNKVLLGNQMVYKVIPSQTGMIDQLATLLVDSFKTQNLVALVHNASPEKSLIEPLVKAYKERILLSDDTLMYAAIKVLKIDRNFSELASKFSATKNNVVFVPSINQSYITDLFNYLVTNLSKRDYKDYQVTLIGLEEWLNFENIELTSFEMLHVYLPVNNFVNEKDSITATVIKGYIAENETYPSKTTLLGYDIATYFGTALLNYGTIKHPAIYSSYKRTGTSTQFNFHKTGIESGYENKSCYIMNFRNFELVRVY